MSRPQAGTPIAEDDGPGDIDVGTEAPLEPPQHPPHLY